VKQLGDDLLAGAVFPGDKHVGVRGADLCDELEHRLHGWCASHEFRHAFSAEQAVFEFKMAGAAEGVVKLCMNANEGDEALVLPGFLNEVASAALDGFDGKVDVAPGGHDDDGEAGVELLDAREQVESLLAGGCVASVIQVDEEDVVVRLAQGFKQQLGRADTVDLDALRGEQEFNGLEDVGLIVGDKDADLIFLSGDGSSPRRRTYSESIE